MLIVKTEIKAPLDKVWAAFNNPDDIINWNSASEDWYCPKSSNDLQDGGIFSHTMAARDGSFSFDFEGVYDTVLPHSLITYTMADGRRVKITFEEKEGITTVQEDFDAEKINPEEMQVAGWQAILDNFKKYVENV